MCSFLRRKALYVPACVARPESVSAENDAQGFAERDGFFAGLASFGILGGGKKAFLPAGCFVALSACCPEASESQQLGEMEPWWDCGAGDVLQFASSAPLLKI